MIKHKHKLFYVLFSHGSIQMLYKLSKKHGADSAHWRNSCPKLGNYFLELPPEISLSNRGKNCANGQELRHVFNLNSKYLHDTI